MMMYTWHRCVSHGWMVVFWEKKWVNERRYAISAIVGLLNFSNSVLNHRELVKYG